MQPRNDGGDGARAHIAFVVTEDWFFASHFLPMARAAVAAGHPVSVVTRVRAHRDAIAATGARVVELEAERSSLNPMAAGYAAGQLAAILKALKADIVHCIALRGILVGGAAAMLAGIPSRVYALTGLGLIGARQDRAGRLARTALRLLIRGPLETARTRYLFENPDDARLLGLTPDDSRVTIVGGAGIDPQAWTPQPLPPHPPLRIALTARMLWSKGVDTAVEAARLARSRAPTSTSRSTARPIPRTAARSPRRPCGTGRGTASPGTGRPTTSPAPWRRPMSPACPRGAARACRAPCSKPRRAAGRSSPPTYRAAGAWCATGSRG